MHNSFFFKYLSKGAVRLNPASGMLEFLNNEIILELVLNMKNEAKENSLVHIKNEIAILSTKSMLWT